MSTPPPVPAVADTDRYASYTVNGASTAAVDIPFPVYGDASDLVVKLDGSQVDESTYSIGSKSGLSVDTLPRPLTDAQVLFSPAVAPTVIEIFSNMRPRWLAMGVAPGIGRREFNQALGYLVSILREQWATVADLSVPAMIPDARGTLAGRATYDDEAAGFVYQVLDDPDERILFYVKLSSASADWSTPQTGTGKTGATGPAGANGLDGTSFSFKNRVINGQFMINQRAYVSGNVLAAGAYGHDRWKAGAGGCTYSFTPSDAGVTITILTGTLVQVVEAKNVEGGSYAVSWTGSAQVRINGGSYSNSPATVTGVTAGTQVTLEFSTGTVGKVQMEPGTSASAYEKRPYAFEMQMCRRHFQWVPVAFAGYSSAACAFTYGLGTEMMSVPTVGSVVADPALSQSTSNVTSSVVEQPTKTSVVVKVTPTAVATFSIYGYRASLEAEI